jgi:DNA adenine methylase
MTVGALDPRFGSKRMLAGDIVVELGDHRGYYEPFCGSCAVLLAKAPAALEIVNDLDGDLVNLARVIQHPKHGRRFYRRCRQTLCHEVLFREAVAALAGPAPEALDPERAYNYFVASWLGRNGTAGTAAPGHSFAVRWTPNGGSPSTRWRSATESIPAWHDRLRDVCILQRDALDVLASIDDAPGVAIYCDPPYLPSTRSAFASARYLHEFERHEELAAALQRFRQARVVVSYYAAPDLQALYPGWTFRELTTHKNTSNTSRGTKGKAAAEVLILNGPSYVQTGRRSLFDQ